MKQSQREVEKEGEIQIGSEEYRTSQVNSRMEINVQPCSRARKVQSHTIHQVIKKRNQTCFVCLEKLQNAKYSGKRWLIR